MKVLLTGGRTSGISILQSLIGKLENVYVCPEDRNPMDNFTEEERENLQENKIVVRKCIQGQHIPEEHREFGDFWHNGRIYTIGNIVNNRQKVIYIYRDGRDTLSSKYGGWKSLLEWMDLADNGLAWFGHANFYDISYEQLIEDPNKWMKEIAEFLNTEIKEELEPIEDDSIGNWENEDFFETVKNAVNKDPIRLCSILFHLGYEKDDSWIKKFT